MIPPSRPTQLLMSYPGSKWKLAPTLVTMFPKHTIFVSPFAGMATEFAFKERSQREILNDDDKHVYSLFAALRDEQLFIQLIHLLRTPTILGNSTKNVLRG